MGGGAWRWVASAAGGGVVTVAAGRWAESRDAEQRALRGAEQWALRGAEQGAA
jgi:hypothetical protein